MWLWHNHSVSFSKEQGIFYLFIHLSCVRVCLCVFSYHVTTSHPTACPLEMEIESTKESTSLVHLPPRHFLKLLISAAAAAMLLWRPESHCLNLLFNVCVSIGKINPKWDHFNVNCISLTATTLNGHLWKGNRHLRKHLSSQILLMKKNKTPAISAVSPVGVSTLS